MWLIFYAIVNLVVVDNVITIAAGANVIKQYHGKLPW